MANYDPTCLANRGADPNSLSVANLRSDTPCQQGLTPIPSDPSHQPGSDPDFFSPIPTPVPLATATPQRFLADVLRNTHNVAILARWDALALPDAWLVAGCLFQTVWNLRAGRDPDAVIKDYDLFYCDPTDLSAAGEQAVQARVAHLFRDLGVQVEVVNQARVHLWYPADFGHPYPPLQRSTEGIDRFLITGTCVGIRPGARDADTAGALNSPAGPVLDVASGLTLYAPNGLAPIYEGELRMNPLVPHRDLYERKARSYRERWPHLRVVGPSADVAAPEV